jgi:hypothetical protein
MVSPHFFALLYPFLQPESAISIALACNPAFPKQFVTNQFDFGSIEPVETTHWRCVVFQMAEVGTPRRLFREILARIRWLRVDSELATAGWPPAREKSGQVMKNPGSRCVERVPTGWVFGK